MSWKVFVRSPRKATAKSYGDGNSLVAVARLRQANGKVQEQTLSTSTLDPAKAELFARTWERKLNSPGQGSPSGVVTLLDVVNLRLEDLRRDPHKSPATVEAVEVARKRIMAELAALSVHDLTRAAVLKLQDRLRDLELAPVTINETLAKIAACWRWAHERELVSEAWPKIRKLPRGPARKRPYQDHEVVQVVEWVHKHAPGWAPVLELLADNGHRVGAIVALRGRDVDREGLVVTFHEKGRGGKRVEMAPVSPEVMALIPVVEPDAYVFPSCGKGGSGAPKADTHLLASSVTHVIRRAIKALGIPDGKRLDVHSLRRAFVASSDRANVPADVGRRVTGHRTRQMWDHYQSQAVGDDLHEAVRKVRERRWGASTRATETAASSTISSTASAGEPSLIARLSAWADEDPAAMRRLIEDEELRAQLARALADVAEPPVASSGQAERTG